MTYWSSALVIHLISTSQLFSSRYYQYYSRYNTYYEWLCAECPPNTYGGGGTERYCTSCPKGRTTGGWSGAQRAHECCHVKHDLIIYRWCVNKWYLSGAFGICALIISVVLWWMWWVGKERKEKSEADVRAAQSTAGVVETNV